ncbi:MAG: B12-binding domain-containing radical SAM protein [Promethearchaeota archaeon]
MNERSINLLMLFPSGGDLNSSNFQYNLGSAYIIAYLKEKGFTAKQFISNESFNVRECVKKIIGFRPKIVGFTVYEKNYMQCVLISKGLKAYSSRIIIIFGGPTPTVQSREILDSVSSIDICVRGEGEEIMVLLLSAFSKNDFKLDQTNLDNINGITFRKRKNLIVNPDSNILLSNRYTKNYLDKYPSPYLSEIIPPSYASPTGIITARGCNQNCIYCNCAIMSKRNIFFHSIERVIKELMYLNEYRNSIAPVPINDDTFTIIPSRTKQICERIIENDIKLPLSCITRCDKINEELLDLMKEAGFVSIGFSLESAVPRVLRAIGKVNPPQSLESLDKEHTFIEKLKKMTTYAKKIGLCPVYVSIMVGLPSESLQDAQKTLKLVKQLDLDFYSHNIFHIFKGTPIYQIYKQFGYKVKPLGQQNKIFTQNSFPFDIYKLKLAPNSATEKNNRIIDYMNLKILSLDTRRKNKKPFFNNLIINSDTLSPLLINWIQENLAINGAIIQLYPNKVKYEKNHKKNEISLYEELSPTMYYHGYYWENNTLKSGRQHSIGKKTGLLIKIKDTKSVLQEYEEENNNVGNTICTEHTYYDTITLLSFLNRISKMEDSYNYLLKNNVPPEIEKLCRWTSKDANCQKLETAIIDNNNSIRICWNSDPIGDIETPFPALMQNLQILQKIEIERRNCISCIEKETCIKCLFPSPLSSQEYCDYKKKYDTSKPARLIKSIYNLKDFIYKPSNLYNK